jgi:predicted GNAT family acetyltransferase
VSSQTFAIKPTHRGWDVVLSVNEEAVSGLAVVDQKVRIGSAGITMAGIAGVWTSDKHRKKGYATQVMWAAIEEMERRKYDISILFGIPDFYHRYGYAVCFTSPMCQVESDTIAVSKPPGMRTRAARAEDYKRIVALYRQTNADRSASTLRPGDWQPRHRKRGRPAGWRMPRMGPDIERRPGRAFVVENARKQIVAYAAYDAQDGHCYVIEVGSADRMAYPAIAHKARQIARQVGAERIRFAGPVDDPFGEYLGRFGCGWSINFPQNSGSMGRVITLSSMIRRLLPVLDQRLIDTGICLPEQGLTIRTDIGSVTLSQGSNGLQLSETSGILCECSQMTLTQLIFGYRSLEDLVLNDISLPKKWNTLLSTLFPRQTPYMWWADRF